MAIDVDVLTQVAFRPPRFKYPLRVIANIVIKSNLKIDPAKIRAIPLSTTMSTSGSPPVNLVFNPKTPRVIDRTSAGGMLYEYHVHVRYDNPAPSFGDDRMGGFDAAMSTTAGVSTTDIAFSIQIDMGNGYGTYPPFPAKEPVPVIEIDPCG